MTVSGATCDCGVMRAGATGMAAADLPSACAGIGWPYCGALRLTPRRFGHAALVSRLARCAAGSSIERNRIKPHTHTVAGDRGVAHGSAESDRGGVNARPYGICDGAQHERDRADIRSVTGVATERLGARWLFQVVSALGKGFGAVGARARPARMPGRNVSFGLVVPLAKERQASDLGRGPRSAGAAMCSSV